MNLRRCLLAALLLVKAAAAAAQADTGAPARVGESIYLRGVLGSGAALQALREGGGPGAQGAEAACVNCHLRSGLGSTHQETGIGANEPAKQIPPIAGRYLFDGAIPGRQRLNLPYVDGMRTNRSAYTEATLARAIREGIDADGRKLGYLMPRFAIGDDDLAKLIDYLKTLDPARVPGVTDTTLDFATIITPDVEPALRRALLDVMDAFFAERNVRQMKPSAPMLASGKTQYSRSMYMVHRQWKLHVWDLKGPPSAWGAQLAGFLAREPVLAVISGLGRSNWAPVHEFCEQQHLACLFPNVEVPVDAPGDFHEIYLSRGVLLEAELIDYGIKETATRQSVKSVVQVYRAGDSGGAAARVLADRLRARGIEVKALTLPPAEGHDVGAALAASPGADVVVLWLRPPDLAALGGEAQHVPPSVFMSGLMGGLEHAPLPAAWRSRTRMAYPIDLPQRRVMRVDYPLGWFRIRKIPVVDEQMQADTYLACGLLSEALKQMAGTFYGPYLIEELQAMVEHRVVTGYYPRLSLAENQHFASKGGYLVHFDGPAGEGIESDSDWIVP